MTDTTNRTRVQAGVSAGGRFAAEPKTETGVALSEVHESERDRLLAIRDEAVARAEALDRLPGGGDPVLRHRAQLRAVAATIKAAYPDAASFLVVENDTWESKSGWVARIYDDLETELVGDSDLPDFGDDEYGEDITNSMLGDIQETRPEMDLPGLEIDGSEQRGCEYIIHIDAAMQPEPQRAPGADAGRAQGLIDHYRAHHDAPDTSVEDSTRAALADMVAFAEREGIDVTDIVGGAKA